MVAPLQKLDLQAMHGLSVETRLALLTSAYTTMAEGMTEISTKMDDFIAAANKRKGAAAVWNTILNIAIGVLGGAGGLYGIMSSAQSAGQAVQQIQHFPLGK